MEQNEWIYTLKYVYIHPYVVVHLKSLKRQLFRNKGVYGNYAMPSSLARHHIRESCNAILFSQSSYMWIVSCLIFSIMYSICQQCLYIHLLFLCISHLSRSWENLEWKQGYTPSFLNISLFRDSNMDYIQRKMSESTL